MTLAQSQSHPHTSAVHSAPSTVKRLDSILDLTGMAKVDQCTVVQAHLVSNALTRPTDLLKVLCKKHSERLRHKQWEFEHSSLVLLSLLAKRPVDLLRTAHITGIPPLIVALQVLVVHHKSLEDFHTTSVRERQIPA